MLPVWRHLNTYAFLCISCEYSARIIHTIHALLFYCGLVTVDIALTHPDDSNETLTQVGIMRIAENWQYNQNKTAIK